MVELLPGVSAEVSRKLEAAILSMDYIIARDSVGEEPLPVPRSGDIVVDMTRQQGVVAKETRQAQEERAYVSAGEGLLTQLLMGTGAGGLLLATVLKVVSVVRTTKAAVKDAVDCGDELASARTDEEVVVVKKRNAKRQVANGTKAIISEALA